MFHGLHFPSLSSIELLANFDSDWVENPTDRHSISGYCFFLGDYLISWCNKKQILIARSGTKAEYRVLVDTT